MLIVQGRAHWPLLEDWDRGQARSALRTATRTQASPSGPPAKQTPQATGLKGEAQSAQLAEVVGNSAALPHCRQLFTQHKLHIAKSGLLDRFGVLAQRLRQTENRSDTIGFVKHRKVCDRLYYRTLL